MMGKVDEGWYRRWGRIEEEGWEWMKREGKNTGVRVDGDRSTKRGGEEVDLERGV